MSKIATLLLIGCLSQSCIARNNHRIGRWRHQDQDHRHQDAGKVVRRQVNGNFPAQDDRQRIAVDAEGVLEIMLAQDTGPLSALEMSSGEVGNGYVSNSRGDGNRSFATVLKELTVQASFPKNELVYIRSYRKENLQNYDGGTDVKVSGTTKLWEKWTILSAPDSNKVLLKSYTGENLQDNHGRVKVNANNGEWEQWIINDVGNGRVSIQSHRSEYLKEYGGKVGLAKKVDRFEKWEIIPVTVKTETADAPTPTDGPPLTEKPTEKPTKAPTAAPTTIPPTTTGIIKSCAPSFNIDRVLMSVLVLGGLVPLT